MSRPITVLAVHVTTCSTQRVVRMLQATGLRPRRALHQLRSYGVVTTERHQAGLTMKV